MDIQKAIEDLRPMLPKDESERLILSEQASVYRFIQKTLSNLDINEPDQNLKLEYAILIAKLIAEIAKVEVSRTKFQDGLFDLVLNLLVRISRHEFPELLIQICRAIANLCFDNGFGSLYRYQSLLFVCQYPSYRMHGQYFEL